MEPVPEAPDPGPSEPEPNGDPAGAPGFDPGIADLGDEDAPLFAWLPPDDRLWRHPSEAASDPRPPVARRRRIAFMGAGGTTWAVAVVAGLTGALAASGIGIGMGWWSHSTPTVRTVQQEFPSVSLADAGSGDMTWTAADDAVSPSVVRITVQGGSGPQTGSGLLLMESSDGSGYVVTDRSLLASSLATGYLGSIEVTFLSGQQSRGRLVGQDALSGLAVIHVADTDRTAPALTGSVADLHDADPVLALGAKGSQEGSVFPGSVGGEDQKVQLTDGTDMDNLLTLTIPAMASTAAGGPLVDQYGRVVGMTVSLQPTDTADQQLSFAVPIDVVNRVADQIVSGHKVTHPWLGVAGAVDVPSAMAHRFGLVGGAEVESIISGSPAASLGMRAGDIINLFNGQPVTSSGTLVSILEKCNPGQTVPISFIDGSRSVTAKVVMAGEPDDAG